jgi:ABC-type dipeptide/oligopeptide/nickel transport system ATPase subunit
MLEGSNLSFRYEPSSPWIFRSLCFQLAPGEIVGLYGPSGKGKSTLAKVLAGYLPPVSGSVRIGAKPLESQSSFPVQLLFQHPELAINPRWKAKKVICEGYTPSGDMLQNFGVRQQWLNRYPHELSGGELSRIAIVRALCPQTRYLIADEMTSMLDTVTQARIWRALLEVAESMQLGVLVISHDRVLLSKLCGRIENWDALSGQHNRQNRLAAVV